MLESASETSARARFSNPAIQNLRDTSLDDHPFVRPSLEISSPQLTIDANDAWMIEKRCGRTWETSFRHDRRYMFIEHVYSADDLQPRRAITSFAVFRHIFQSFFGDLGGTRPLESPDPDQVMTGQDETLGNNTSAENATTSHKDGGTSVSPEGLDLCNVSLTDSDTRMPDLAISSTEPNPVIQTETGLIEDVISDTIIVRPDPNPDTSRDDSESTNVIEDVSYLTKAVSDTALVPTAMQPTAGLNTSHDCFVNTGPPEDIVPAMQLQAEIQSLKLITADNLNSTTTPGDNSPQLEYQPFSPSPIEDSVQGPLVSPVTDVSNNQVGDNSLAVPRLQDIYSSLAQITSVDEAATVPIEAVIGLFDNDYEDFISRPTSPVLRPYTTLFPSGQGPEPAPVPDLGEPGLPQSFGIPGHSDGGLINSTAHFREEQRLIKHATTLFPGHKPSLVHGSITKDATPSPSVPDTQAATAPSKHQTLFPGLQSDAVMVDSPSMKRKRGDDSELTMVLNRSGSASAVNYLSGLRSDPVTYASVPYTVARPSEGADTFTWTFYRDRFDDREVLHNFLEHQFQTHHYFGWPDLEGGNIDVIQLEEAEQKIQNRQTVFIYTLDNGFQSKFPAVDDLAEAHIPLVGRYNGTWDFVDTNPKRPRLASP